MNDNLEDNGQFKMRLDEAEVEETPMPADVEDLRIEKLSHRMTMITILIPVLLVVILVIAYLDIKKRVIQTEDTGQLTAETLSRDLESRFESLTMTQKGIEENLARLKDQSDQSLAKIQIDLKKLDDRLKSAGRHMVSQKDMKATKDKLDNNVANVAQSVEELKLQVAQLTESLQPRISELKTALDQNKTQFDQLAQKLTTLDRNKIDRAGLDLAVKLEGMKIKQAYKAQMEELQSRLDALERQVAHTSSAPSKPAATSTSPAPAPEKLEEQTIGK
jgi:chromosome segregation ATPase